MTPKLKLGRSSGRPFFLPATDTITHGPGIFGQPL